MFQCYDCHRQYTSKIALTRHIRMHGDNVYKCPNCDMKFQKFWDYFGHLKTHKDSLMTIGLCLVLIYICKI